LILLSWVAAAPGTSMVVNRPRASRRNPWSTPSAVVYLPTITPRLLTPNGTVCKTASGASNLV
jgi:hypothetical protein